MAGKFTLLTALTVAAATTLLSGCLATTPVLGGSTGNAVSGSAAGANAANQNAALESCESTLGTLSVFEDRTLPWWGTYNRRHPDLGSTMPVIRLLIQQSGCFVVVERGAAMDAVNKERALMNSGELRDNSSFEKGQMVAADYTMSPSVQFSETGTGGVGGAIAGRLLGSVGTALAGGLKKNEAATTMLLIDNRSGVQISGAVGSAANYDINVFGGLFKGGFAGLGAYGNTPAGKIVTAAFTDSYNQMVVALRSYRAQQVDGGLGKGGKLEVGQ